MGTGWSEEGPKQVLRSTGRAMVVLALGVQNQKHQGSNLWIRIEYFVERNGFQFKGHCHISHGKRKLLGFT